MADFDLEQMRVILMSLADRLAQTKGDEMIVAKLQVVEKAMRDLQKQIDQDNKRGSKESKKQAEDYAKDFINRLEASKVFEPVVKSIDKLAEKQSQNGQINAQGWDMPGKFSKGMGSIINGLSNIGGALGKFSVGIDKAKNNLDGSLSGLAKAFGADDAGPVATVLKGMDNRIDAYRILLSSAEGTIQSLGDLGAAMNTARMGAKDFAEAIAAGGRGARLFGAMDWASMHKAFKEQASASGMYGYTLKQLATVQNTQLEIISNQGDIFSQNRETLSKQLDALLKVNAKSAFILGKSREDQLKAIAEASRDPAFNTFMHGAFAQMGDEQAKAQKGLVNVVQATLGGISPALKDIFQDQFMLDGAVRGEAAQTFALLPQEMQKTLTDIAADLKSGQLTNQDEANARIQQLGPEMAKLMQGQNAETMGLLARLNEGQFQKAAEIFIGTQNLRQEKATNDILGAKDAGSTAMLQMENLIQNMSSTLDTTFTQMTQPILNEFGPKMQTLIKSTDDLILGFDELLKKMGGFSTAILTAAGLLGGGLLLSKTAGMASIIFGRQLLPMMGNVLRTIATPLIKAAGLGASAIATLTSGTFIKNIATSISSAVGTTLGNVLNSTSGLAGKAGLGLAGRVGFGALSTAALVYNMPDQISTDNLPTSQDEYNRRIEEQFKDPNSADAIANRFGDPRSWIFNALGIDDIRTDDLTNKQYRINSDGTRSYLDETPRDKGMTEQEFTDSLKELGVKSDRLNAYGSVDPTSAEAADINKAIDEYITKNPEIMLADPQPTFATPLFDEQNFESRFGDPQSPNTQQGPLTQESINERLLQTLKDLVSLQREIGMNTQIQLAEGIKIQEDILRTTRNKNS